MSTARVPANTAALLTSRVVSALLMVAIVSVSAHRLSVDEFGIAVSTMAAGFLANSVVTFGTDMVVTRSVAAGRDDATPTSFAALRLQLIVAGVFIAAATAAFVAGLTPGVVLIQAVALVPLAFLTVAAAVLRGAQVMGQLLVATSLGSGAALIATLIMFEVEQAAWVPVAGIALGGVVAAVAAGWAAGRVIAREGAPRVALGLLVRETVPFAAMVVLAAIGAQGGLLLVELVADEPSGGYGAGVRLTEAARLVPAASMGALFPAMFDGAHRTERYERWTRLLFGYAAIATAVLWISAGLLNTVVFDDQPDGAVLIRILAIGIAVTVARLRLSFELIAEGKERTVLDSAAAGTGLFLVSGIVAARTNGAVGVAWAQVVGLTVAVGVLFARRRS